MARFRTSRRTHTTPAGTKVIRTTLVKAPELEWVLQAAAVRRLRQMPGYLAETPPGQLPPGAFTLAADFNAARRSPQEAVKAKATGISAGEPDLRIYGERGRLLLIEYKAEKGRLSDEQKKRHPLLEALGYTIIVIRSASEQECADMTEAAVMGWLADNDN